MESKELSGDFDSAACDWERFASGGLGFQVIDVSAKYFLGIVYIFEANIVVFDVLGSDEPFETGHSWVDEVLIKCSGLLGSFDVTFREPFHVACDCFHEDAVVFRRAGVKVMEA